MAVQPPCERYPLQSGELALVVYPGFPAQWQVFFAYAVVTPDECTLFANPLSLTEAIRQYLHANGVAVLDYEQIWTSLSSLNGIVTERRARQPIAPADKGRSVTVQGMKLEKTDKVLIGTKTSWAIAQAVGEVSPGWRSPVSRGQLLRAGQCRSS